MKIAHPIINVIDTHKATHVSVAIDTQGTRLVTLSIPANPKGHLELKRWSQFHGMVLAFGLKELVPMALVSLGIYSPRGTPWLR